VVLPKSWYLPNPPQVKNSGLETDEFLAYSADYFEEMLEETFLGEDVVLYRSDLAEGTALYTKAHVYGNTPEAASKFDVRQLITRLGQSELGLYVKYKGEFFLVTEIPGDNGVHQHSFMTRCDYDLRWKNDEGDVVERKCVFKDATIFSFGESTNKSLILGNVRLELYLPMDDETLKIGRGKRFIIDNFEAAQFRDPMVYNVTKTNFAQKAGLKKTYGVLMFMLTEHSFNPATDDKTEVIADFKGY